jgi:TPR repeat protein
MFIRIIFVFCFASFLISNGVMAMDEQNKTPGLEVFFINEKEMASVEKKALDGDPESADRLGMYYSMVKYDLKSSIYWTSIAAENGSVKGQYNLGVLLRDDPDPKNRRRAVYWLKRVSKSDNKDTARRANRLIDEILSKEESDNKR